MGLSLKQQITRNLLNIPGWRTNRKIVVIESDDWGSIRMPSREVYEDLLQKGIRVDKLSYNRYDSLASENDLSTLFEVLSSVKDKNGNPAVFTANTIVANPDFDQIRASGFQQYFYEAFTETLKRYPRHSKSFALWNEGIEKKIFIPQFHGREHLNITRWLKALQNNVGYTRLAFDYRMFDLSTSLIISENSFMEALNYENINELEFQKQSLKEGLQLFNTIFGYRSKTFIAPVYIWDNNLNKVLKDNGVVAFQGSWYQLQPIEGKEHRFKKQIHFTGQNNKLGQRYLVRNAAFEPSQDPDMDWINDVMLKMKIAFRWGKPAIIGTHRINYIGFIDTSNRDRGLKLLKELLQKIVKQWPDVEFMSTDQLVELIRKN